MSGSCQSRLLSVTVTFLNLQVPTARTLLRFARSSFLFSLSTSLPFKPIGYILAWLWFPLRGSDLVSHFLPKQLESFPVFLFYEQLTFCVTSVCKVPPHPKVYWGFGFSYTVFCHRFNLHILIGLALWEFRSLSRQNVFIEIDLLK